MLRTHDGMAPLLAAGEAGCAALVRLLVEGGADPNLADLGSASRHGHASVVRVLLEAGADKEAGGSTPHARQPASPTLSHEHLPTPQTLNPKP